jgi:hypothetical protein
MRLVSTARGMKRTPRKKIALSAGYPLERGYQLETAKTLGLDYVGVPISSDAIASLFGVAKRHGMGQTQHAARMVLRLPALCGAPTREEAEQAWESAWRDNMSARDKASH